MAKTIFITGASRGFGKLWATALLERGDKVIATARNVDSLKDLADKYGEKVLTLQLDVTNKNASFEAIHKAKEHFGSIDVLINNAGYGLFAAVEETTEQQAREQMETNFFGLLWLTQAVIPIMREQGSGHIIQLSSIVGLLTMPILGLYNASKFAVEGLSETLAGEVASFGIKVTLVEPNAYATEWGGASAVQGDPMPEYDQVREAFQATLSPEIFGSPEATSQAILTLIDTENPPLRLPLGKWVRPLVLDAYQSRKEEWKKWQEVSDAAHGS